MKKIMFVVGLASGVLLAKNWRNLTKEGIKTGIRVGRKVREFSQQAIDEIEDITAEALEELPEARREEQV